MARDFQRPFARPAGAVEVLLVRHGSAAAAEAGAPLDGHADPSLTLDGRAQAEAVCARLAAESPARLFVTPMRRTAETAAPLAARLAVAPTVVPQLREVHLGSWEGAFADRLAARDALVRELFAAQRWDVIPHAEPDDRFRARVRDGLEHVARETGPDAAAVAVVHGGVIAEACRQATGSEPFAFLYAENGSITRLLRLASGRWALRGFNDVAHLAGVPHLAAGRAG
ncbi:histidine phosphatase family protein [Conexibacter sp. JD483]|uniref:histidine phosphatase family protein n=1 Tax=unclassified Conexibacter TaxID=2627773 RepID=UPI00271EAE88|nr:MULTISPECIES: histidine phosphatase family protein [unclassified Conexibacter]MDO8187836.1 histidine phosphatase family protein [Conexibacter sp. CPCC 205706]MDO8199955.1 histidine phosphatase family protein [Conexibacter sp. CPCC 205762]MDR9369482.1 histidine phosphatase family protein [Conexibacter sp. JD483]